MLNDHILTIITFVPVAGAVLIALLPRRDNIVRWCALLVSLLIFALTLHLPFHFNYGTRNFQFVENQPWITSPALRYHLGVDGISMWLVVLTGLLAPLAVLASWKAISTRTKEFYFFFLLQQTAMFGVFLSLDIILYYFFWELSLIPMAILIAMFGRTRGPQAAMKFFLYTFIPSALFLVGILYLYAKAGTFDLVELQGMFAHHQIAMSPSALEWVAVSFLIAFAVKVPVFPLHGWLGDVFSEAPTAMAMVVAGKLGLYSLLRFDLGLFPAQARAQAPWIIALSVIGILYGALNALVQRDMKRIAAFATLSAISFCTLGFFGFTLAGVDGGLFQTLNEPLIGSAILIMMGLMYERYGTYDIAAYGGLASRMPWLVTFFVITGLALVGLPLLSGFVGEFLVLSSTFARHVAWGSVATLAVIFSAAYALLLVQKIFYGKRSALVEARSGIGDLNGREHAALWPLIVLMLVMGIASGYWMKAINPAIEKLTLAPFAGNGLPPSAGPNLAGRIEAAAQSAEAAR